MIVCFDFLVAGTIYIKESRCLSIRPHFDDYASHDHKYSMHHMRILIFPLNTSCKMVVELDPSLSAKSHNIDWLNGKGN